MVSHNLNPHDEVVFETADDIFIKQIALPSKNVMYPQHVHSWNHTTLLVRGRIVLWKGNAAPEYHSAPDIIFIEKNVEHKFQTLEDNCIICCVHNLRSADGALRALAELDANA